MSHASAAVSRRPRRDDGPSQLSFPFSSPPDESEIAVVDRRGQCVPDAEWRWDRDWHADLELQWERDWQIARDRQRRRARARGEARPGEDLPDTWKPGNREAEFHAETNEPEPEPYGEIRVRQRREPRAETVVTDREPRPRRVRQDVSAKPEPAGACVDREAVVVPVVPVGRAPAVEDWTPFDPLTEIAALDRRIEQAGGVPGRRTIEITGHAPDVYVPRSRRDTEWIAAERIERPRYEPRSYRPDRAAMWAVVLGLLLVCAAAASAHAAVVTAIH